MSKTDDLFAQITNQFVEAIETGNHGKWEKTWTQVLSAQGEAFNPSKGHKGYHGLNDLVLMLITAVEGYPTNVWATYKQWEVLGGQVQKGQSGTVLVKWGVTYRCDTCNSKGRTPCQKKDHEISKSMWASPFTVFNLAQQEGFDLEIPDLGDEPTRLGKVEEFIGGTGAEFRHAASNKAFFDRGRDQITLPLREQFDTTQAYYGTALHELTHWSGHKDRLDRKVGRMFGDDAYGAEELVAELGATFLAAKFGVEVEPHPEHVAYLGGWIESMKLHPKALYSAAKMAQASTDFLTDLAGGEGEKKEEAA